MSLDLQELAHTLSSFAMSIKPLLLDTIQLLQQNTLSLHDTVAQYISIIDEGKSHALIALQPDLNSLGACLRDLHTKLCQLENHDVQTQCHPPILNGCKAMIQTLASEFHGLPDNSIFDYKWRVNWFRSMFSFAPRTAKTPKGTLLYLSILRSNPPADFRTHSGKFLPPGANAPIPKLHPSDPSPNVLAMWMVIFNSPLNSREPEEYYKERLSTLQLETVLPGYSIAAITWPEVAQRYWSTLRPSVFALCNPSNRYNFTHWALQYARTTWPRVFGWDAPSAGPLIDLTDALCSGTIVPLHIAAALGIQSLSKDLISAGSDVKQGGPLGTPLQCALVGPDILVNKLAGQPFSPPLDSEGYATLYRRITIQDLLAAGADCASDPPWEDGPTVSMASLSFWASLALDDESLIKLLLRADTKLDKGLEAALQHPEIKRRAFDQVRLLSCLMTSVLDRNLELMAKNADPQNEANDSNINDVLQDVMSRNSFVMLTFNGSGELENVSDADFKSLLWSAFHEKDMFTFRRLTLDNRFNPNISDPDIEGGDGSMLHLAVEINYSYMVSLLLQHNVDLTAVDRRGRTPLMLVMSTDVLSKLVEHGASTTDVDVDGRSIWHMAAATNDVELLEWLCKNDPTKEQNLLLKTKDGNTPLAEAFLYIEKLEMHPLPRMNDKDTIEPRAARRLLKECDKISHLCSTRPLVHLAAAWGEIELIEGLVRIGADFREGDEAEQLALHHLNFSASVEVVRRLLQLCGVVQEDHDGECPFQTIFFNVSFYRPSEDRQAMTTSHPSCRRPLSKSAYAELLTPETLAWKNRWGSGFWKVFIRHVVMSRLIVLGPVHTDVEILMRCSIGNALDAVIESGAMKTYEEQTGECAVLCLLQLDDNPHWNVTLLHPYMQAILEHSNKWLVDEFVQSLRGRHLFKEAALQNRLKLVEYLCARGMRFFCEQEEKEEEEEWEEGSDYSNPEVSQTQTFLQSIIDHTGVKTVRLAHLLKYTTPEDLNHRQKAIYEALCKSHGGELYDKTNELIDAGLGIESVGKDNSILEDVIFWGQSEVARALIEKGANIFIGQDGCNAWMSAVERGDTDMFRALLRATTTPLPPEFFRDTKYKRSWRKCYWNIIQTAAFRAMSEMLEMLFREMVISNFDPTTLINGCDELHGHGETAAHLAADTLGRAEWVPGGVKSLNILVKHGADLTRCNADSKEGREGYTPLHIAVHHDCKDAIELLLKAEPLAMNIKDTFGRTPLQLAKGMGRKNALKFFKEHGFE